MKSSDPQFLSAMLVFGFGVIVYAIVCIALIVDVVNRRRIRKWVTNEGGKVSRIKRIWIGSRQLYIPIHYEVSYFDKTGKACSGLCISNRGGIFWEKDETASKLMSTYKQSK